jgi:hypothetical protein
MNYFLRFFYPLLSLIFVGCSTSLTTAPAPEEKIDVTPVAEFSTLSVAMNFSNERLITGKRVNEIGINIKSVEIHKAEAGWFTHMENFGFYSFSDVDGDLSFLTEENVLDEGHYTMVRLILDTGNYFVDSKGKHSLNVPSGFKTGIKVPCNFELSTNNVRLDFDFDLKQAIGVTANGYYLKPVIKCRVSEIQTPGGEVPGDLPSDTCQNLPEIPKDWCSNGEVSVNLEGSCMKSITCVEGDTSTQNEVCPVFGDNSNCSGIQGEYYTNNSELCMIQKVCLLDSNGDGFIDFVE